MEPDDFFAGGEPDAGALEFVPGVKPAKDFEDPVQLVRFDSDAVVFHMKAHVVGHRLAVDPDLRRRFRAAVLQGVGDQVGENLADQGSVAVDRG